MLFMVLIHSLTSLKLEAPVDTIIGFLVFAILSTKLRSVFSNEAILYNFTFKLSKKSTALVLKGVLKSVMPNFFAILKASWCHLKGV